VQYEYKVIPMNSPCQTINEFKAANACCRPELDYIIPPIGFSRRSHHIILTKSSYCLFSSPNGFSPCRSTCFLFSFAGSLGSLLTSSWLGVLSSCSAGIFDWFDTGVWMLAVSGDPPSVAREVLMLDCSLLTD